MQRMQKRFSYLLNPLPESFEKLLLRSNLNLNWEDFPIYDLETAEDQAKLAGLCCFFEDAEKDWQLAVEEATQTAFKVCPSVKQK